MSTTSSPSVLGRLRSLVPRRADVSFDEALRISELQASCLIDIVGGPDRIDATAIGALPHVRVVSETIAVSGMSLWTGNHWLIAINSGDSLAHQRFTLLHQFKHVVDHGHATALYSGSPIATSTVQAERAADYFAGCVLVPKRELEALWDSGLRHPQTLAAHFGVSVDAMLVRLGQVKLNAANDRLPHVRCAHPVRSAFTGPTRSRVRRSPRCPA